MLTAVTGINWGDEGKGRVIDLLAEHADIVARYQGGNNAGHTVVTEKGKFILNLLPSGILHPDVTCVLGTGMVIDLEHLANEMQAIEARGVEVSPKNLKLSDKATISMPWHKVQDGLEEDRLAQKGSAFGSTRRGIAYAYSDKYRKKTLRLGDLLHLDEERTQNRLHMILDSKNMELAGCYHQEKMSYDALLNWCKLQAEHFTPYICDVGAFLQQAHDSGKRIVLEAQLGAMRDIDYGIFPFTSSSNTLAAYAPLGAGIPNCKLDHVVGVLKSYSTCVGAGPFAAENAMGEEWNEKKSYITGDVVTLDGVSYTATHYSRGKSPASNPDKWTRTPTEEQIGAWADLPDGEVITEGTKVTHNGKKWVCVAQHFKSSVYSPRVNSTKWEEIT